MNKQTIITALLAIVAMTVQDFRLSAFNQTEH